MRFLLPPSETKVSGGSGAVLKVDELSFANLNAARKQVIKALETLSKDPLLAAKVLKLGSKNLGEAEWNLQLKKSPTLPAFERYDGTLFDALKGIEPAVAGGAVHPLSDLALSRIGDHVFIQSALFGLVSATDALPAYRLSGTTALPGAALKKIWPEAHAKIWRDLGQGVIVDLRSKAYAELAPLPSDGSVDWVWVDVVHEGPDGVRKPMNHFNKKAKGVLVRAALQAWQMPITLAELGDVARSVGLQLEPPAGDRTAVLVTRERVGR